MSIRLTPEEQEKIVIKNMNLVYHMIKQLPHINPNDYDDWVQIGRIGLIKAVSTFDETKGKKFSTYASVCIKNEIYMHLRKERTQNKNISLNDIIYTDGKGSECQLQDILGNDEELIEEIEDDEIITNALGIILNILQPKEAVAILYKISGIYTQKDIGESLGVSQSYASRLIGNAGRKIRKYLETEKGPVCTIFSMVKKGNVYLFRCNTKYYSGCLKEFLRSKKATILLDYKVMSNEENIEICMPSYTETFVFVAEFIKEISYL